MVVVSSVDAGRLESGLALMQKVDRPADSDLRILIFTATYFVLDGVTLTIRRLESHLRSNGATVKILSTVPDSIDPELTQNIIVVPGIKIPFNNMGDYSMGVGLDENTIAKIEEFKPNVVHFTVPDFVALEGIRWCQRNNVAYMGTWHSNYGDYLKYYFIEWAMGCLVRKYLKSFFEQIPTVYVPTNYLLVKLREKFGYGSCTELKEWGRGVDMNMFSPERRSAEFRASKGVNDSDVVILWVSRLVPEKRPDIFLNVVKRLQEEGLPVKAFVVGNGTFEKYLSKLNDVTCCGWLSGVTLGEVYASSDVLLFPSDVETFGNVTLEALSSGTPCVVEEKCSGHLVDHGVNGLCCPAGDNEAFFQATRALVVDSQRRRQMSIAAREGAWKFERNVILQQMAENYKDAIVKHRDPTFLKEHLKDPEAAGKNILSILCCDYYCIRQIAEPFLASSGAVQNLVDHTSECVDSSRTHLSCETLLTLGSGADDDIVEHGSASMLEEGFSDRTKTKRGPGYFSRLVGYCPTGVANWIHSIQNGASAPSGATRFMSLFAVMVFITIAMMFIYASFTV